MVQPPNFFPVVIAGGGAAGFFAALAAKKAHSALGVLLLERTNQLLSKVRISGGGRCNVTHACFDPAKLVQNYPRGHKALLGPFTRFQPRDIIDWFQVRGVVLKTEPDGRVFPKSDSSQTIIDCFLKEARSLNLEIRTLQHIERVHRNDSLFQVELKSGEAILCEKLLLATGSSPHGFRLAQSLGHTIQEPIPSLFTLNIPSSPLSDLAGISVEKAALHLVDSEFSQTGPLLITHWGFSGPCALKLSAWGARYLHKKNYSTPLKVNWLPEFTHDKAREQLRETRNCYPNQNLVNANPFMLPKNLWKRLIELSRIDCKNRLSEMSNASFDQLCQFLQADTYQMEGKTTYKEEFVTCGGVTLDEVSFKTMESRLCSGLFFAGEILDIDGITGGFNFQSAWTTGWIAGHSLA
jgi:predicted Rossmann fold flavoprotein